MVNTKHDTAYYDSCGYKREIYDANLLYESFLKAKKGSAWKPEVQRFEMGYLGEIAELQEQLKNKTFEFSPTREFILFERGKTRAISSQPIQDRVVEHALCDEILVPAVRPHLIYDNGASIEGKGIGFTRKRLLKHLHKYYYEHGNNNGYILLIDFKKYYDNVRHSDARDIISHCTDDNDALWIYDKILADSRVDVSYMNDDEYSNCMDTVFNSLEYEQIDHSLLTGERFMSKHLDIGKQSSQISGVAYRIPIDNYVKIVKGLHEYAGYMDDTYAIHESKEYLQGLLMDVTKIAAEHGVTINQKKTRICKLSDHWRFLQIQYSLTDTGRVIQKINPKRLTSMRRRMKKVAPKVTEKEFTDWYKSWFKSCYKYMSKQQRDNMDNLFNELKKENLKCIQSL